MKTRPSIALTVVIAVGTLVFAAGGVMLILHMGGKVPTLLEYNGMKIETDSVAIIMMILGAVLVLGTLLLVGKYPSLGGILLGKKNDQAGVPTKANRTPSRP